MTVSGCGNTTVNAEFLTTLATHEHASCNALDRRRALWALCIIAAVLVECIDVELFSLCLGVTACNFLRVGVTTFTAAANATCSTVEDFVCGKEYLRAIHSLTGNKFGCACLDPDTSSKKALESLEITLIKRFDFRDPDALSTTIANANDRCLCPLGSLFEQNVQTRDMV